MTESIAPQLLPRPATVGSITACARLGRVVSEPTRRHRSRHGGASSATSAKFRCVPTQPQPEPERGFALLSVLNTRGRRDASQTPPLTSPLDAGQLFVVAEPAATPTAGDRQDALVGHLRERVDALAGLLEEERRRRRAEVAALSTDAAEALARQAQMQEAEAAELAMRQRDELARIVENNAQMLQEAASRRRESLRKLESRIEYLDGGFHTFVQASGRRFEALWSEHATQLSADCEAVTARLVESAAVKTARETVERLAELRARNAASTERLRRCQAEEMTEAREARAKDEATLQRLEATSEQVKERQSQLQSLRRQLESRARELREARRQLAEAQSELQAAQSAAAVEGADSAAGRLAEVEAAWQERLTRQRRELEELRQACEEVGVQIPPPPSFEGPNATPRQRRASFPASSLECRK